jgi:hypothetical protein
MVAIMKVGAAVPGIIVGTPPLIVMRQAMGIVAGVGDGGGTITGADEGGVVAGGDDTIDCA